MQNSLSHIPDPSHEKILSTENSRNSTFTALVDDKQKLKECDSSFRLFTFMKQKNNEDYSKQQVHKREGLRKKSTKKIITKQLKKDSSGLIDLIEQSRKKREDFLRCILTPQIAKPTSQQDRKCRTPTNNLSVRCFNIKKSSTPKVSMHRDSSFADNKAKQPKLKRKSIQQKNTNIQQKLKLSDKHQHRTSLTKIDNQFAKDKRLKQDQTLLLKKKKQLQKQLLQINQTLLLGHQKKKTKSYKAKK